MSQCVRLIVAGLALATVMTSVTRAQRQASGMAARDRMEKAISASFKVKSIVASGRILAEVDAKTGLVVPTPAPISLKFLAPDRYLREVESVSGLLRQSGFSGSRPIFASKALRPGMNVNSGTPNAAYLAWQRALAARLWIGMTGTLDGPLPLNIEADSTAAELHITGPDEFVSRIELSPDGVPVAIHYHQSSVFFYTPPVGDQQQAARRSDKADMTLAFLDRKRVGGALVPHRITLTARSESNGQTYTQEEVRLDTVTLNGPLTEADFIVK